LPTLQQRDKSATFSSGAANRGARRKSRRTGVRVLIAVLATVVLLVTLEGLASLALVGKEFLAAQAPVYSRPHTTYDTLLGWVNRPNASNPNEYGPGIGITTNAFGLRGSRTPDVRDTTKTRIACSGDSFTLGYGVSNEHTWCALLESELPGIETLNMGQAAYGADQAYLWYRRDGDRVRHQVHIFAMISIELERATTSSNAGRYKPMLVLDGTHLRTTNVPVPAQSKTALNRAYGLRALDELRLTQTLRKFSAFDGTKRETDAVEQRWPVFEAMFDDLLAFDRQRKVDLVLAYLPVRADASPGPSDARRAKLAAYARARGVPFLDFTPELRAMSADSLDRLYITRVAPNVAPGIPGHYSNLGNAWAAKLFASRLASLPALAAARPRREPARR
jgi:hypothetical protein